MYRQGDVLLEAIDAIPSGLALSHDRLLVRGEGRNHGHFIMGDSIAIYPVQPSADNPADVLTHYLEVNESASLEHQLIDRGEWTREHAPIEIPPGRYRVIRQREYNPYARAIRLVRD